MEAEADVGKTARALGFANMIRDLLQQYSTRILPCMFRLSGWTKRVRIPLLPTGRPPPSHSHAHRKPQASQSEPAASRPY